MLAPGTTAPIRQRILASTLALSVSNLRSSTLPSIYKRQAKVNFSAAFASAHMLRRYSYSPCLPAYVPAARLKHSGCYRTNAASVEKAHSACDKRPVTAFQSCLAAGSVEKAIDSYSRVRQLYTTVVASTHTNCQDKRMRRRRSKATLWDSAFVDLRQFHLLLRKASLAKNIRLVWKGHLLKTLISVISDMRLLGLQIGATEVASEIYAFHDLGRFSRAIDLWRENTAVIFSQHNRVAEEQIETHIYALKAAVRLKNVNTVRDIYTTLVNTIVKESSDAAEKSQYISSMLALTWTLFPSLKRTKSTTGSDYPWDPSRLGYAFLRKAYLRISEMVDGSDQKMLAVRILRYMIRALCLNGDCKHALHIYLEYLDSRNSKNKSAAPEVLCEMVGGLCKHGLIDEAYELLSNAGDVGSRSVYVWNTYFDGLIRHPQKILKENTPSAFERLQNAMHIMRDTDGIEPDTVTWSIWIRACFQMGDWHGAFKCFRDQYETMSRDVACWDTVVRGLFQSRSREAHAVGWQLVEEFIARSSATPSQKDSNNSAALVADNRIVETVLLHCFPRFSEANSTYAYEMLSGDTLKKVVSWIEANISPQRKIGHAIMIGTLLKKGQIKAALAMHQSMIDRQLWPTKSINCMIVRALGLAGSSQKASQGSTSDAIKEADCFILHRVPKQHYAAAYLPLVKSAAQDGRYTDMWALINRHYPWVPNKDAVVDTTRPFPDADMYQAVLSATEARADWSENRHLLDKLRHHLDLVSDCGDKKPKTKMAGIYNHYIRKHF